MDTTASRGGVAPDGSAGAVPGAVPGAGPGGGTAGATVGAEGASDAGPARVRVEVEAMPDGRTIRYYAAAPHVRDFRGDSPENHAQGPEARP